MMRVYGMSASGNCHKVRMVLEALRLPYQWTEIDTVRGDTRTAQFLAMNPNGKAPVLEIEPGTHLPESNAILSYLADGTPLLPSDRLLRARVLQWLFFEQYSHEPYIAVARFLRKFHPDPASQRSLAESKMDGGYRALEVMEGQLRALDVLRRRALQHRRHRALRLHARRARGRFRSRPLPGRARLACARRSAARLRRDAGLTLSNDARQ